MERINPFNEIYKKCNGGGQIPLFPWLIDIELTNYCNYRCLMCPTGIGAMKRKRGFMSTEIYTKIIEEISQYQVGIRFIRWGEPTLHRNFCEFIEMAKAKNIICHFNTNGLLLDERFIKQLIALKMDSVKFSFQGVDRKSYQEMRNKDAFDDLVEKIKIFHALRGDHAYPYLQVSTTTTYETDDQISAFRQMIEPYTDFLNVGKTNLAHIQSDGSHLSDEEKERLNQLKQQETLTRKHPQQCPEVFAKLSINWDGSVTACCSDYDNFMVIGNLRDSTLKEIWESDKLNQYRKLIANGQYEKLHLCKTCFDYIELKK